MHSRIKYGSSIYPAFLRCTHLRYDHEDEETIQPKKASPHPDVFHHGHSKYEECGTAQRPAGDQPIAIRKRAMANFEGSIDLRCRNGDGRSIQWDQECGE